MPVRAAATLTLCVLLLSSCVGRGDGMPPSVAIREPRSGSTSATANLRIIGYAFDDEGVRAIRVDGVDLLQSPSYETERGKRLIEFAFTIRDLSDGVVTVLIEAEDARGNITVLPYRLQLDSTPPTLELTSVTTTSSGRLRVEGVARDNLQVVRVVIGGVPLAFPPAAEHTFRVDVDASANAEVVVEDAAGNIIRRNLR